MVNYEDKSNNELLLEIKQLEASHIALKNKLLNGWDELMEIEKNFNIINQILLKRLKGE